SGSLNESQHSYCIEVSSGVVEVVCETNQFWRLTQMTALNGEQLSAFALLFSANPEILTIELGQFKSEVLDSL
ncbi:N-acetyltransferase, partial [Vibrio echinoideorum]